MAELKMLPSEILRSKIHIRDPTLRNALSEFYGTTLLIFIGLCNVMQFILSGEKLNTWIQVNIGWGLAVAFCVYACSKTSGGHLNPAISFAMLTLGKLSTKDFFIYWAVQTVASFVAAIGAFAMYYDQFVNYAGYHRAIVGPNATAACFCSFPASHVTNVTCFFDQIVGTGLLALFACVVIDKRNRIPEASHPFLFGFIVVMIGTCMGMNLGYPINPARDLGPRFFAFFIYGSEVFTYHDGYFWIPIIAPMVGAGLAAWSYQLFIGAHIPDENKANGDPEMPLDRISTKRANDGFVRRQ